MKKILTLLLVGNMLYSCDIRNTKNEKTETTAKDPHDHSAREIKDSTTVEMIDTVFNFGKITDGENVSFSYRFRNTGKNPLIISAANASCGCTVPEKPEEPIKPGEIGHIKVAFNSKGRVGEAHKEVTVVSNARPEFPALKLRGEVLAKK